MPHKGTLVHRLSFPESVGYRLVVLVPMPHKGTLVCQASLPCWLRPRPQATMTHLFHLVSLGWVEGPASSWHPYSLRQWGGGLVLLLTNRGVYQLLSHMGHALLATAMEQVLGV